MLASLLRRLLHRRQPPAWLAQAAALHQAGRYREAAALCETQLAGSPDDVDALQALAAALAAQGRARDALPALERAVTVAPGDARLHAVRGRLLAATGAIDAAIRSFREALARQPDAHRTAEELIALLQLTGRYDEAEDACRGAMAAGGDAARLHRSLAAALFEQGCVEQAIVELERALAVDPRAAACESDLLRALNYAEGRAPAAIFDAHRAWALHHEKPLAQTAPALRTDALPDRKLRVGYVSPHFRKHAVTFFLESVIEHHDRGAFDIVLYADVARPDEYSERLKRHGAQWRSTVGLDDATLARKVREDAIDILVDLSGHTPGHRLLVFARRAAPVQVTWNGYPNTTGLASMDYRVTDALCDPPGLTEHLHTEQLVRLPDIFMSWRPPADAPAVTPLPASLTGRITFASFNSCYKLTDGVIATWARLMRELPDARLILFAVPEGRAAERLRRRFDACGIAPDHIEIRPRLSHEGFLKAHGQVDIALDSFPYHGTTTTCFSLWMGVPVVSLVGETHVSRVGLTLLSSIGLAELAADTADEYVAAAVRLAHDRRRLATLRAGLRERMLRSALTDGAACARALEAAYREMWKASCAADEQCVPMDRHEGVVGRRAR